MLIYEALGHRPRRGLAAAVAVYGLALAPLVYWIVRDRVGNALPASYSGPSADQIYSLIRVPWHVAPFSSWPVFVRDWLPGYCLAAVMLAGSVAAARLARSLLSRRIALWLTILLAYLFVALFASYLDRKTGMLGKLYLFRPTPLIFLLWLMLAASCVREWWPKAMSVLRFILLTVTLPIFCAQSIAAMNDDIAHHDAHEAERLVLYHVIGSDTGPLDVVLIDPRLEDIYYDFERRTGRASLITWKFANTRDSDVIEWYRRVRFRATLFDHGCGKTRQWPVNFLVAAADRADALSRRCGPILYRDDTAALIRVEAAKRGDSAPPVTSLDSSGSRPSP